MRRLLTPVAAMVSMVAAFSVGVGSASAQFEADEFEKTQLVGDEGAGQPNTLTPMEIEVAPDGTVFYTERRGVVGAWDPDTETSSEIGTVPVTTFEENGLMGIALAPDYETSGWIYLSYSALPLESLTQRLSRFQLDENGDVDMASEEVVFEWTHLRETCCHSAGALEFDPDGNLLISTGDNTNPFDSNGFTPIDERDGRESWDAQRTAANTNDHNGKLLRITPHETIDPGTDPGVGETYDIPEGNMFPAGPDTLPEIYAMGFRNPFRFKVDEETGWALLADYGPDAGAANPERGPQGSVEYNVITEPGNFGWPYCVRQNTPYIDGDFVPGGAANEFESNGMPFDCEAPVNDSVNNTGLANLEPVEPATMWMGYSDTDARVPGLGTGGAPMAGPRYYFDPANPSPTKFPEEFDGKWFIAEWNNDWIKTATLDEDGNAVEVEDFADLDYLSPMDMEFGPDGSLYVAEWGQGFGADHPESGIYRIDHVELTAPQVTASADPDRGTVPLEVAFDGEATNPDGSPNPNFEYEWDFGDGGPVSTEQDPTHTYTEVGEYTATLTVTDPETEEQGTATVEINVNEPSTCPTGPLSDEFDGAAIDPKWSIIRPDGTRPPTVSGGELHFPIDNGSIYGPGTSARNIMVQPLPDGEVSVTAKIEVDALSENYQQAGLRVYSDDDNWASIHMISAGGQRDFEFIYESEGNPRNEAADKLGGIPADAPLEYYVRINSDGDELTAEYSYDGVDFEPVGRPASLDTFDNPRIGPVALSDVAATFPVAHFDWVRFDPDAPGGGGGDTIVDEFDGSELESPPWETVRPNANLTVSGGALRIPAENGDLYGGSNTAQNLVLRDAPEGPWEATAEINFVGDAQYHQAGILVYGDDSNYTKLGRIAHTAAGDEKFEYIYETAGTPRNEAADSTANLVLPDDYFVRITSDGTNITGAYSTDGTNWTPVGRPAPLPADARVGMFAFNNEAATSPEAAFESFELVTGTGGGPSRSDQFDGATLDTDRWNAIVNDNPEAYELSGGVLRITTEPGDIYTGDTVPPPNNFILQSADHAEADWTIETKVLGGALDGGYSQGGLMAMQDTDNYVKFDLISDQDNTAVNRIELRSEVDAAIQDPQPQVTPLPAGTEDAWLRLTKTGQSYTGEYSLDGETWVSIGDPVANPMAAPDFGIFAFGAQQGGDEVGFDYFTLDGEVGGCPPGDNEPPVIDEIGATPTAGFAPLEVDFNAAASDPDDDELSYSWDFGDGSPVSTEQNPTHTYMEAGDHEAELTVSDGEAEETDSVTVTVLGEDDPGASFRALAFSKTAGFRHSSIDEGHAALDVLAEENGFQLDHTEDASLFTPEILAAYDTVVFLSTTGDVLDEDQQAAFEEYIQSGGGYVGIHSASDTEYEWNWYGHLVGAYFISHPPGTANAAIDVEEHEHASTAGLPDRYERIDEWYNFKSPDFLTVGDDDYPPRGAGDIHILATVDESTYDEQDGNATDDDHPMTWCQRYDGGRSWYTAMGHTEASYVEPNFLAQVLGGLETTAGVEPSATCGVEPGGDDTDLRLNVQPKRASTKVGKQKTFRASVRNTGDAAADAVRVCAAAPRKLASIAGKDCVRYPSIAEADSETARFKVKAKRKAAGKKVTLRFTVRAANADRESAKATLKVKGKKKKRR